MADDFEDDFRDDFEDDFTPLFGPVFGTPLWFADDRISVRQALRMLQSGARFSTILRNTVCDVVYVEQL